MREGPRSACRSMVDVTWVVSGVLAAKKKGILAGLGPWRRPNAMHSSDVCIMHVEPCNVNGLRHLLEVWLSMNAQNANLGWPIACKSPGTMPSIGVWGVHVMGGGLKGLGHFPEICSNQHE